MKNYIKYVSPFLGNGEIDLPKPSFPASTWHFIKGLSGNTNPAAALPFGKYSCLGYDGAYPTGNGINCINCGGAVKKLYDSPHFIGLSHFQHSGTGAIGVYYNYALTSPYYGKFPMFEARKLIDERAEPGYYYAKVEAITAEATVSDKAAAHRYTFENEGGKLAIDFANDGLYNTVLRCKASGSVKQLSDCEVLAEVQLSGITLWFNAYCYGGRITALFSDDKLIEDTEFVQQVPEFTRFGVIYEAEQKCEVRIAVSAKSAEHACEQHRTEQRSFDEMRQAAAEEWQEALSKIEICTDDERELEIFYSNLYHTLIKPCDLSNEAFLFDNTDGDFIVDIATMWDIYKTQLPLLFTLYPEIPSKILGTLKRFGEKFGYYPHCILLSGNLSIEAIQARTLAEYSIYDAYLRGIEYDYDTLLDIAVKDFERYSDYMEGKCEFASHILDMAEAYTAMSELAAALKRNDLAVKFASNAAHIVEAFDTDGIMRADSDYYEGNRYNYSFRPLANMKRRMDIIDHDPESARKVLEREAKRFFGYSEPENFESRFEGFNNETDMEAPYFLHCIGRRDLLCEVISSGLDSMFTTGRGGIPGNADSGGLTSCYIWNAIGVFPVSGQNRMIIGTPRFEKTVLHMLNGDFTIERVGEGIYTESAYLNGRLLENFEFSPVDMVNGGHLKIYMKSCR